MLNESFSYRVETRFTFASKHEAIRALPFLEYSLHYEVSWATTTYGKVLFAADRLLRISNVVNNNRTSYFIGFKEPDVGEFCNIRLEIDEEIT